MSISFPEFTAIFYITITNWPVWSSLWPWSACMICLLFTISILKNMNRIVIIVARRRPFCRKISYQEWERRQLHSNQNSWTLTHFNKDEIISFIRMYRSQIMALSQTASNEVHRWIMLGVIFFSCTWLEVSMGLVSSVNARMGNFLRQTCNEDVLNETEVNGCPLKKIIRCCVAFWVGLFYKHATLFFCSHCNPP